ncbi:MAG: hypothetical protein ACFFF4_12840 [Candidatus Thorarchaeota archaeon]
MIRKKFCLITITLILFLMLPAMSTTSEANYTRAINDISTNKDGFVISQQVGWSDDFDHGNITESGWSVQAYSPVYPPWEEISSNITADDGAMRGYGPYWNQAWRSSNVAYGSWAFDVHCVENTPANRSYVAFVSGEPVLHPPHFDPPFEYGIITCVGQSEHGNHTFVLYRRPSTPNLLTHIGEYDVDDASGWWHINITRHYNGTFNVYFNDTLGITVSDSLHIKSELFSFYADTGYAIDNIVVVPYPDLVPPVIGNPALTPSEPNSSESVLVNVDVIDTSDVDTVILSYYNDTTWFNTTMTGIEPDYEGTIPALPIETEVQYRIYASDTIDNWNVSETYSYTVEDLTPTTTTTDGPLLDLTVLLVVVGGIVLVVVLVLIIKLRK